MVGLGNVIGSTILAYFWDDLSPTLATNWDKVNLLATFGPFGGLLVTYLLLFIALMLVIAWEKHFFRQKSAAMANVKGNRMKTIVPDYRLDMVGEPCPYRPLPPWKRCLRLRKGDSGSGQRLSPVD